MSTVSNYVYIRVLIFTEQCTSLDPPWQQQVERFSLDGQGGSARGRRLLQFVWGQFGTDAMHEVAAAQPGAAGLWGSCSRVPARMGAADPFSRAATRTPLLQEVLQRQHSRLEALKLHAVQHHRLTLPRAISAELCCTWRWQLPASLQLAPGQMLGWVQRDPDGCWQGAIARLGWCQRIGPAQHLASPHQGQACHAQAAEAQVGPIWQAPH